MARNLAILQKTGGTNYTLEDVQFWAVQQNTTELEIQVFSQVAGTLFFSMSDIGVLRVSWSR